MFSMQVIADFSLELLDPAHAEELFQLTDANRQHLMRWLPWVDGVRAVVDTKEFIQSTQSQWTGGEGFRVAIRHHRGGNSQGWPVITG